MRHQSTMCRNRTGWRVVGWRGSKADWHADAGEPVEEREFERLRAWRLGQAQGKPAFTVAADGGSAQAPVQRGGADREPRYRPGVFGEARRVAAGGDGGDGRRLGAAGVRRRSPRGSGGAGTRGSAGVAELCDDADASMFVKSRYLRFGGEACRSR